MIRIPALLVAALALIFSVIAPTAAASSARYGAGTIQVTDVHLKDYGCFDHPYSVNLVLGAETTEWYVEVDVLAPNGTYFEQDSTPLNYGSGTHTITGTIFFCSSLDPPGVYTIQGVVGTYEGATDYTATETPLQGRQFSVHAYAPPPPPPPPVTLPPPPPPPIADVKGKAKRIVRPLTAIVRFTSEPTPSGHVTGDPLRWKIRWDNRRTEKIQTAGTKVTFKKRFSAGSGQHRIRVYRNGALVMSFRVRTGQ